MLTRKNLIVGISVLVLVGMGIHFYKKRVPILKGNTGLQEEYKKLYGTNDPATVRRILTLMKNRGVPESLDEAMKRVTDSDPQIRQVAADILGFFPFNGKIKAALETLAKDPDAQVRLAALESVSQKMEPARAAFLNEVLKHANNSAEEVALCHFGLFRLSQDPKDRQAHFNEVLTQASSDTNAPKNYVTLLITMAPKEPRVVELFQKRLNLAPATATPEQKHLWIAMYRHLVFYSPETLKNQFAVFANHADPELRRVALMTVDQLCPPDRWTVLKSVVLSTTVDGPTKSSALAGIEMLGSKQSADLAQTVLDTNPPSELKARAERIVKSPAHKTVTQDKCDLPKINGMPSLRMPPHAPHKK